MKNIHLLPTDKPSRLYLTTYEYIFEEGYSLSTDEYKHIYITSDELPKLDEWGINIKNNVIYKDKGFVPTGYEKVYCRKIIFATDLDLINDGVQAIDDEFLEWFVNNPSCEEVEVKKIELNTDYRSDWKQKFRYKIMIPKEEPKQETLEEAAERMYSEEEVLEQLNILMSLPSSTLDKFTDDNGNITMKWFEQF
jgi:hypothetical protein